MNIPTPVYNHDPIIMRQVADGDAIEKIGDFAWSVIDGKRSIWLAIPCTPEKPDSWTFAHIPVKEGKNVKGVHWGWDGHETLPTLVPSLHTIGHWHGYVHNGMLVEARP